MEKQKLLKTGSVYFISSIIINLINIFLIPLYTRNLNSAQFGQFNIVASIQGLLSIFITVGIYSGMSRFLYEYGDKNRVKNITLTFSFIWGLLMIIVSYFISPIFSSVLFSGDVNGNIYFRIIVINSALLSISSIYESYYSMKYEAVKSSAIKISKILFTFGFSICFVVIKDYKVEGILYSQFWAYFITVAVIITIDIKNIKFTYSKKELKEQLVYGIGLVPGQISAWILTLIDRYFIKTMINLSAVGVYSLGYKIGMLIEPMFISPFNSVFTPFKFKEYKESDGKVKIQKMFKVFNLTGWFCIFVLAIFGKIAVNLLGTKEYISAFQVIPIIAFSYYLWGLGSFYALGLHIANKMFINSGIAMIGAILNIILNFLLIPRMNYFGAAIATVISYIIINIIYFFYGKKYYDIGVNLFSPYKYGVVFAIIYPLYYIISSKVDKIWFEVPLNIILCIIYISINILIGFISSDEARNVICKFNHKFNFRRRIKNESS